MSEHNPELFVAEFENGEWIDQTGDGGFSVWMSRTEAQDAADCDGDVMDGEEVKIVRYVREDRVAALESKMAEAQAERDKARANIRHFASTIEYYAANDIAGLKAQRDALARALREVWDAWPDVRQLIEGWWQTTPVEEWSKWDEQVRQTTVRLSFVLEQALAAIGTEPEPKP